MFYKLDDASVAIIELQNLFQIQLIDFPVFRTIITNEFNLFKRFQFIFVFVLISMNWQWNWIAFCEKQSEQQSY